LSCTNVKLEIVWKAVLQNKACRHNVYGELKIASEAATSYFALLSVVSVTSICIKSNTAGFSEYQSITMGCGPFIGANELQWHALAFFPWLIHLQQNE
jgi:hypothetical protein